MSKRNVARLIRSGLLSGVLVGCGLGSASQGPSTPSSVPTSASAGSTPSSLPSPTPVAIDLSRIVFGPEEAPAGMALDDTITGPETLTLVVISGQDAEFEALDGFVDGRATFFSGEGGALLTLALAFDDTLAADVAMHRYQRELKGSDGYGFGLSQPADFAFEGICDTGANPAHNGLEESICIWRAGGLVLIVGGPQPRSQIEAIAEEINARAER